MKKQSENNVAKTRCYNAECRSAKKYLRDLINATEATIKWMDAEMNKPGDESRGKRIAAVMNSLELQKDVAKRYGLPGTRRRSDVVRVSADAMNLLETQRRYLDAVEVARALREYIDAIPKSVDFGAMPGVDRDWVDSVIDNGRNSGIVEP